MLTPVAYLLDELANRGRQGRGVLMVVSAGNRPVEISRPEQFPAYPALLAATALDHRGAPYGNAYGTGVFIAAPGMVKTTGTHHNGFEPLGATSAAAPVVSGVAALMLAANPQLSRAQVKKLLTDTADRSPPGDFVDGRSTLLGVGRIHAGRAVAAALATHVGCAEARSASFARTANCATDAPRTSAHPTALGVGRIHAGRAVAAAIASWNEPS